MPRCVCQNAASDVAGESLYAGSDSEKSETRYKHARAFHKGKYGDRHNLADKFNIHIPLLLALVPNMHNLYAVKTGNNEIACGYSHQRLR